MKDVAGADLAGATGVHWRPQNLPNLLESSYSIGLKLGGTTKASGFAVAHGGELRERIITSHIHFFPPLFY